MVGPILKESIIFIVFCHIFVSGEDILEIFRPNPSLPQELNEWLASVQKHKSDFRSIREAAARMNKRNARIEFDDEDDDNFEEEAFGKFNLRDTENLEDQPKNDIYPYMYKKKSADLLDSGPNNVRPSDTNNLYSSRSLKNPLRLRRDLNLLGSQDVVKAESKSNNGEIKRADNKYPERYIDKKGEFIDESEVQNNKNNFKGVKDNSKAEETVKKREIEIDIRNNGHLIKKIKESEKNPRPILLNIQAQGKANPTEAQIPGGASRNNMDPNLNPNSLSNKIRVNMLEVPPVGKEDTQVRSVNPDTNQMQNKEASNNFKNLFAVNEHLNTDSSMARETGAAKNLVYHITLPEYGSIINEVTAYPYNTPPLPKEQNPPANNKHNPKFQAGVNANVSNFNRNNLQDMSNFWSASEKNRLQKGIEIARNNENFRKFPQSVNVPTKAPVKENETGFEPAQRIELDNDDATENQNRISDFILYKQDRNSMNAENNDIPNVQDPSKQNKRQLELAENKRQLMDKEDIDFNKNDFMRNLDDNSAVYVSPMDSGAKPNLSVFEKLQPLDITTTSIVVIDSVNGDKILEGSLESVSSEEKEDNALDAGQDISGDSDPLKDIETPMEENNLGGAEGLPPANSLENGNVEQLSEVEGVNNDKARGNSKNKNVHYYKVHKFITKTESITEIDYPEEVNGNHHNALGNGEFCGSNEHNEHSENEHNEHEHNEHLNSDSHHHKEIKLIAAPVKKGGNHQRENKSPESRKIVIIRTQSPYSSSRNKYNERKSPRLVYDDASNEIDDYKDEIKEPYGLSKFEWNDDKKRSNEKNPFGKLMINKKYNFNANNNNKKYQNGGSRGKLQRLSAFESLLADNHRHHFNRDNDYFDNSKSESDFIPAFIGRKLNEVEYAYDADLEAPEQNSFDEISTELQEAAMEGGQRLKLVHRDSVEGDYGDEEDSITEKNKANGYSIIKKTDNEFANPRTTTESDYDDDYNEDYENNGSDKTIIASTSKDAKRKLQSKVSGNRHSNANKEKNEGLMNTDINSFAHHLHKKFNPFPHKHAQVPFRKANRAEVKDKKRSDNSKSHKLKRQNSKSNRFKRNRIFNARHERNSDFQHWPSFVINDHENEENLKKRSLETKKKFPRDYNFPLASKDFFVRPQRHRRVSNSKDKPIDSPPLKVDVGKSLNIEKRLDDTESPSVATEAAVSSEVTGAEGAAGIGGTAAGSGAGVDAAGGAGAEAGTDDDSSDDNTCKPKPSITNVCEENENFNHTELEMTTILAIVPDSLSDVCENKTSNNEGYETLDDILTGQLAKDLLNTIFLQVKQDSRLKRRFNKGLKRTDKDATFANMNDTNSETRKLINAMSEIINKLEFTTTCQNLPHYLVSYLKSITKVKKEDVLARAKEMEEVDFDEGQNQGNFIFESINRGGGDSLQEKIRILKELLDKFNNLPDKCKSRARPVKEYIENHLGLLNGMDAGDKPNYPVNNPKRKADDSWRDEGSLVQEQLDSLGLGNEHNFKPKFSLDDLIENRKYVKVTTNHGNQATEHPHAVNVNKRDIQSVSTSIKYKKLLDAVRKVRLRREGQRRLGEMYGKSSKESNDYSDLHDSFKNTDAKYISRANFESPLVYSL